MFKFRSSIILFSLVLFFFGCCGSDNFIQMPQKADRIEQLENSTVVLLKQSNNGEKLESHCGAVFISEKFLVTARHCTESLIKTEEVKIDGPDKIIKLLQLNIEGPNLSKMVGIIVPFKTFANKSKVYTTTSKERPYFSIVVAYDPEYDITLLESIDEFEHPYMELEAKAGRIGEPVDAIGHPGGFEYSYSQGFVANWREDNEGLEYYQISNADIYYGSSGSGIINEQGKLLGICSAFRTDIPNMSMYVPASVVRQLLINNF